MCGHAKSAVEKYLKLAKVEEKSLRKVATPCIDDHLLSDDDFQSQGHLNAIAAHVVLTCLYPIPCSSQ